MQGVIHNAKPVKWLQISLHKQANKKLKKSFSNADKLVGALRACLFGLGFSLAFLWTQLRWKAVVSFSAAHETRGGQRWPQLPGHLGLAIAYTASVLLCMPCSPTPWKCLLCHAGVEEIKEKIETICAITHPIQRCLRASGDEQRQWRFHACLPMIIISLNSKETLRNFQGAWIAEEKCVAICAQ